MAALEIEDYCSDCGRPLTEAPIVKHWDGNNHRFDTFRCWERWFQREKDSK